MKKLIAVVLSVIFVLTLSVTAFSASPSISINADKTSANVGDTITVTVNLSANANLGSLQYNLNYDTSCFKIVSATASNLFMAEVNTGTAGKVGFFGISLSPVNGAGATLTVKLSVIKTGGKISLSNCVGTDDADKNTSVSVGSALTINCAHGKATWVVDKNATCTEKGKKTGTCPCGATLSEDIPTADHQYGGWTVITEATATQEGLRERKCSACGKIDNQKIPMISEGTTLEQLTENITENTTVTTTQAEEKATATPDNAKKWSFVKNDTTFSVWRIIIPVVTFFIGVVVGAGVMFAIFNKKKKDEKDI